MQISTRDVYETGQRIGWCARPLQRVGPFGPEDLHALVTDAALHIGRLGDGQVIPHARLDDVPRLRELWRAQDAEWLDKVLPVT